MFKSKTLITGMLVSALTVSAIAEEEAHIDAFLAVDPSGKLITGGFDFDTSAIDNLNTRVYEAEFEGPFGADGVWTTDEPGFNAISNTTPGLPDGYSTLPGSTSVTWNANAFEIDSIGSNFWFWDGSGEVNFAPVVAPTVLEISKAPAAAFSEILDGSDVDVTGFEIDESGADGFLHKHIDFSVFNTDASDVTAGFYLWSLTINAGDLATDPLYFVHGLGLENEEAHEAAAEFIESTLVPEPASAMLVAAGATLLVRRRRSAR